MFGKFIIFCYIAVIAVVNADDTKIKQVVERCDEIVTSSIQLIQLYPNINAILNQTITYEINRYVPTDPSCYLLAAKLHNSNHIKNKCRNSNSRKKIFDLVQVLKEELSNLSSQLDNYSEADLTDKTVIDDLRMSCRVIGSSKMIIFTELNKVIEETHKCAKYEIKEICSK